MSTAERLWATIAVMLKLLLLACSSGCGGATQAAPAPAHIARLDIVIHLAEVLTKQNVPDLPDDLKKKTGSLPPAAAPVERAQPNTATQPAGEDAPGAAQLPVVLVYGPVPCVHCVRAEKELNDSGKYAASHATITPAIQRIANEWNQGGYPIATFRDTKDTERFVAPWRGIRDFDQRYNRTMKDRAATGLQDAAPPNVAAHSWPAGTNTENSPAFLRWHLVNHHGYSQSSVNRMTDAQCWQVHQLAHGSQAQVWDGFFGMRRERLARKGKL